MMGIVVPETCWASNKICNKNTLFHRVGILFPHVKVEEYTCYGLSLIQYEKNKKVEERSCRSLEAFFLLGPYTVWVGVG
jgi:hypothetical protein